jgi:hypothetical protein
LITANQDSDSIGVFRFNLATGNLAWTGNEYRVPSPNFVCSVRPHMYPSMAKEAPSQERAVPFRSPQGAPAIASRL